MRNIWAHDMAERMKIRRKVIARDSGLGDVDVGTFPSEGATHTIIDRGMGPVGPLLLGGLLTAAGFGGFSLMSSAPALAPPAKEEVKPIELEIEVISSESGPLIKSVRKVDAD